jgi:nucleoid-associated protein YgaU/chemotaxis signal transduction protein
MPFHELPFSPPIACGAAERGGEVLPVLDLATVFGRRSAPRRGWQMILMANGNFRALVLCERALGERKLGLEVQRPLPIALPYPVVYGCYTEANSVRLILNVEELAVHFEPSMARHLEKALPAAPGEWTEEDLQGESGGEAEVSALEAAREGVAAAPEGLEQVEAGPPEAAREGAAPSDAGQEPAAVAFAIEEPAAVEPPIDLAETAGQTETGSSVGQGTGGESEAPQEAPQPPQVVELPEAVEELPDVMELPEIVEELPEAAPHYPEVMEELPEVMELPEIVEELPEVAPELPPAALESSGAAEETALPASPVDQGTEPAAERELEGEIPIYELEPEEELVIFDEKPLAASFEKPAGAQEGPPEAQWVLAAEPSPPPAAGTQADLAEAQSRPEVELAGPPAAAPTQESAEAPVSSEGSRRGRRQALIGAAAVFVFAVLAGVFAVLQPGRGGRPPVAHEEAAPSANGAATATAKAPELELSVPAERPIETPEYVVKEGDTLWGIAERFTGNPFNYPRIAGENRIADPDRIYPGQRIRLTREK